MVIVSLLFPGFGQALVHRRVRAVAWAIAALVGVLGILATVWLYPLTLLVHVAAAVDAAIVLRRDARPGGLDRAAGALVVVLGAVGAGVSQLALESYRVPSSSMYPTIEIGDHIFVDKLTVRWRPVARGELVVVKYPCDPRIPYIKRVIALAGDTVEVRCDVVYVNGTALPHALVAKDWEYEDRDEASGDAIRQRVSRWHEELGGHAYDVYERIDRGAPGLGSGERDFPRLDSPFGPGCTNEAMFRGPTKSHEVKGEIVDAPAGLTAVNDAGAQMNGDSCALRRHYVVPKDAIFTMGDNRYNANDSRFFGAVRTDDVIGRVIGAWWNGGDVSRIGALR